MTEIEVIPVGGLELLARLERDGQITPTALTITDPDFPIEQWAALGAYLGEIKSRTSWYLGDWINFGASGIYGERYSQAIDVTGLNPETLSNYAWVCRNVARSRRRENLSFGVHAEVAKLEPREQAEWLDKAELNGWKRAQIREAIRGGITLSPGPVVLPADPLGSRPIIDAARSIGVVREQLRSEASPAADAAIAELDKVTETLVVAAAMPSLRDLAVRIAAQAVPSGTQHFYAVPMDLIDELRLLVQTEGGTE